MNLDDVRKLSAMDRMVYWIKERESIRLKREAKKPAPWTDDPILHRYRFCNVRRMDDKVSRWLLHNWYGPYKDHPNMLAAVVLARHFNLPDTLTWFTNHLFGSGIPNWERIKKEVRARKANGNVVFNNAYMVRGIGTTDKTEMVVDNVTRPLFESSKEGRIVYSDSMRKTHEILCCFWGVASFMAGQIVADLRWAVDGDWKDKYTWAPMGPGSARGLARLLYCDEWEGVAKSYVSSSVSIDGRQSWNIDFSHHVLGTVFPLVPVSIKARMEAHDFQNCLCEFDKYERTLWDQGKPKQRYTGSGA